MELLFQEGRKNNVAKKVLKINSLQELKYPFNVDGYILGIDKFSYLFEKTFNVLDIKKIIDDNKDKEIFVSFNRIIYNDELSEYKKTLLEVDKLGVKGIIVGDVAALTYDLKTDVILDQFHLNNSYYTINHYFKNGVKGVLLTDDITGAEIEEIKQNTDALLFKNVFGFSHLSTSARNLVTNYMEHFNIPKMGKKHYEIKENKSNDYYKITEDDFGTHILDGKLLNLLGYNLPVDYEVIDGYLMDEEILLNVLENINDNHKVNEIIKNKYETSEGFINKKTIYKVKKNEW